MSRLSQIFQSSSSTEQAIEPIIDGSKPADADVKASSNLLDQIKPKLKELVQDAITEEQKLCSDAKNVDIAKSARKVPFLPRLAHQLPQPIKNLVKKILCQDKTTTDPSTENSKKESTASQSVHDTTTAAPVVAPTPISAET